MSKTMLVDMPNTVTRVELIDNTGRVYVKYDVNKVMYSLQDDEQTLKVFVNWTELTVSEQMQEMLEPLQ